MLGVSRRHRRPKGVERVWACCAVLLDYPTTALIASLDDVQALVPGHAHLTDVIGHLRRTALGELQQEYVETFDHTRRCAPYLTYFAYGDTRRRGVALVRFKQTYRRCGVEWDEGSDELPDHLCAVLQFGATVDADAAWRLLNEHRAAVEMLRIALAEWDRGSGRGRGSPWLGVLVALSESLPELKGEEAEAVRRLIEQGPPAEEVGLEPYGIDPLLAAATLSSAPLSTTPSSTALGAPR